MRSSATIGAPYVRHTTHQRKVEKSTAARRPRPDEKGGGDRPKKTPLGTLQLLSRAGKAGLQIGALCRGMHTQHGEAAVRRILGVLSLAKKHGAATVDDACAAALEMGVCDYRFVRRYLERNPQLPLSLRQVDPLIRQLTLYRDFIDNKTKESET